MTFYWESGLRAVHLDVGHEVSVEPLLRELEVVSWAREEVDTSSGIKVLETQEVLCVCV